MNLIYVIQGLAPKEFQTNYFIGRQEEKVPSDQRQVQSEQDVENPHAYGHLGACCQIRPIAVKAKGGMKVNETIQAVSHQSHQLAAWINPMMSCPNLNEVSQRQTMKLNKRKTLRPRAPKSSMATTKAAGSSLSWRSLKPNCPPAKETWATQTHIGSQHLVDTPNPIASLCATLAQLFPNDNLPPLVSSALPSFWPSRSEFFSFLLGLGLSRGLFLCFQATPCFVHQFQVPLLHDPLGVPVEMLELLQGQYQVLSGAHEVALVSPDPLVEH